MPPALILTGGEARRLGGADKSALMVHGRSLRDHLTARLRDQVTDIVFSVRHADEDRPDCVADAARHRGKGPLAGLHAGLVWAAAHGADTMLSVPVDTPFIPLDLVARLAPAPAVASYAGRVHHLVALWPVAGQADRLDHMLDGPGPWRVADFARAIGMRVVAFAAPADPFLNINTPSDHAAAEAYRC